MPVDSRFYELRDGARADTNGSAVRVFRVPAASEILARDYFLSEPSAPKIGDPHLRDPALVCQRISVGATHGTDSYEVSAEYGFPGTGGFSGGQQPDQTEPGTKWLAGDFSFREIKIPYFRLQEVFVTTSVGGATTPTLNPVWTAVPVDPLDFAVQQAVYRKTVTVSTFTEADALLIFGKLNKIHTFGNGKRYLFTGASFDQQRVNSYTIRYEWVYESDTDLTLLFAGLDPSKFIMPPKGNVPGFPNSRFLPAYHGFTINQQGVPNPPPNTGTVTILPKIETAQMYANDADGWSSLPGDPLGPPNP